MEWGNFLRCSPDVCRVFGYSMDVGITLKSRDTKQVSNNFRFGNICGLVCGDQR